MTSATSTSNRAVVGRVLDEVLNHWHPDVFDELAAARHSNHPINRLWPTEIADMDLRTKGSAHTIDTQKRACKSWRMASPRTLERTNP